MSTSVRRRLLAGAAIATSALLAAGLTGQANASSVIPHTDQQQTRTAAAATPNHSIWPSSAAPTIQTTDDPSAVELGVKFQADVDGYITGVRFWKGPQNTGTHSGTLWASGGTQLATVTFTGESASGWQEALFSQPVRVTANTTYVASYHTNAGMYPADAGFFTSTGVDRAPLHALRSGVSGTNGVFVYGASTQFPSDSWQDTNYWVDVVFTADSGPDTTAPTVSAVSPAENATGVATSSSVTATFNEALDPSTVSTGTVTLATAGGGAVTSSVSYDSDARQAVLQPSSTLAPTTQYTVTIKGETGAAVKDVAGNALAANRTWSFTTAASGACDPPAKPIVVENCKQGSPESEWQVSGSGDPSLQGFATDISVNKGQRVGFKIDTSASSYRIDIYRLGWYGGDGARKVDTIATSNTTETNQPACMNQSTTGLVDCGSWSESASWAVPSDATSGLYIARPVNTDTGRASHIPFVVRDDSDTSDLVFQTSDTTWQAYNEYGGNSLYTGSPAGRAYKVSYNRPFTTRDVDGGQDWIFNSEYPMIRFLERNGYDMSYVSGVDMDRTPGILNGHKTYLSVGHDEYWSANQRANVEAARSAGVNLAFFSGNEVYWKTRFEDGGRTMVTYKETHADAKIDPSPEWTGTWRDPRFSPPADGGRPENGLTGTLFMVNAGADAAIRVPEADGKMRFWRNTGVANLAAGATATMPAETLGYEWDADVDNGFRPPGLVRMSTTIDTNDQVLQDDGSNFGPGTVNHALTLYRGSGGGLVFGAGTVQWAWGLDSTHDRGSAAASPEMQQATVNLLADMSAQPATRMSSLAAATKSTDTVAPTAVITNPTDGSNVTPNTNVTISGTATDTGGGRVGAVEVSTDGTTWHPTTGRGSWSYTWRTPASGDVTLRVRAADDSANLQSSVTSITVTATTATSTPGVPTGLTATAADSSAVVAWTAPVDDGGTPITGYTVRAYRVGESAVAATKAVAGTATTATITGLANGTGYTFRVTASNTVGEGAASAASDPVTPVTVPGAPSQVAAAPANSSAVVTWTAPADNGGTPITGYTVRAYRVGESAVAATKAVAGTATTATITGLANGTGYTFRVTASNTVGEGAASAASDPVTPVTVPGAPSQVAAAPANSSAVVTWTAPADNGGTPITGYTVRAYRVGESAVVATRAVSGTVTTATITGLANGIPHVFTVTAVNSVGEGKGATTTATPVAPPSPSTAPSAPTGVRVASVTSSTPSQAAVTLTWAAPASNGGSAVTGYTVRVSQTGQTIPVSGTVATITGLRPGTGYTFSVAAHNTVGVSTWSASSAAVVPPAPKVGVTVTPVKRGGSLYVNVNPNMGRGYWKFKVQQQRRDGTWRTLRTTYKTQGSGETRTINKSKGTYRVVVAGKYGYAGAASNAVRLAK